MSGIKLLGISIHAPAKGATGCYKKQCYYGWDFNPRSREGSDRNPRIISTISKDFNPRSREGSDYFVPSFFPVNFLFQSTLPRRERPATFALLSTHVQFQSTLPRRERPKEGRFPLPSDNFNPRSREGSDLSVVHCSFVNLYFNPRSREGSDVFLVSKTHYLYISIHAPAKGATGIINM